MMIATGTFMVKMLDLTPCELESEPRRGQEAEYL